MGEAQLEADEEEDEAEDAPLPPDLIRFRLFDVPISADSLLGLNSCFSSPSVCGECNDELFEEA